jgi:hypothetical protein
MRASALPRHPLAYTRRENSNELSDGGIVSHLDAITANADLSTPAVATLGTNFLSATYNDTLGYLLPDAAGAVGTTQFLTGVNGRLRSHNKNNGAVSGLNVDMDVFFSPITPYPTYYPRIRFDRFTNRWIITVVDGNFPSALYIATSNTADITSSTVWQLNGFLNLAQNDQSQSCILDYPTLGIDVNALYIGVNQYCGADPNNVTLYGSDAFVIKKSTIFTPSPLVMTRFANIMPATTSVGPFAPHGVDNFDPNATAGYFIGVDGASFSLLQMRRISDPGSDTPTISGNIPINVATTRYPIDANHKGNTGGKLDALDDRLQSAVIRNGKLYTVHHIQVDATGVGSDTGGRDGARWYELSNIASTPTVSDFGTIYYATASNPTNVLYPSLTVTGQGHKGIGYTIAGVNQYADAAMSGYLNSGLTTMFNFSNTSFAFNPPADAGSPRLWGSYSATSIDPCDDMTTWTIQEYTALVNTWGVRVAKFIAPPPTITEISPSSIPRGLTAAQVTITGTGLFDPGVGFNCRLSSTVAGLNSTVTYNSPTSITLTINTVGAALGSRAVTITNPDGQSVNTSLTIAAGTPETIGIFRPSTSTFYLRNSNTTGIADITITFGASTDKPVVGDWNGDGIETPGVYRASTGQFFLTDQSSAPATVDYSFVLGIAGDTPIVGDWDGDGKDGVGIFRPSNGLLYLKNGLTTGFADFTMVLGIPGDIGVAGDWNGDGKDSPGVYRPSNSNYYLTNQVCDCSVFADFQLTFGVPGDLPFIGDWNGDGISGIGAFRTSNGLTFMRNALTQGFADIEILYGITNDVAFGGHWQGGSSALSNPVAPPFVPASD